MLIKVGADPFPPYQYETDNGIAGMDYELIKAAFAVSGVSIDVTLKVWPLIEKDYNDGLVRALFQVQPTKERMKENLFSGELRKAVTEIITVKEGRQISSLDTFYTENFLAVLEGYSYGDAIDAIPEKRKHRYKTHEELLTAVSGGKEAFGVFDSGVRLYLQETLGVYNIVPIPGMDFFRPLAVMFRKDDKKLCNIFDSGLQVIKDNGSYREITKMKGKTIKEHKAET